MQGPAKLLVIEDEEKTAAFLLKGLSEHGFAVDLSPDGDSGLQMATDGSHDLLLLDVMLPGRDGWSVLAGLRHAGKQAPVLILTALSTVADRVRGLRLGADDFLVKPFAFSELLARIESILRRTSFSQSDILRVADLEIDLVGYRASRAGRRLDLTPKEFQLLALLARLPGRIVARSTIAERLWGESISGDANAVEVHVRRIRAKVDDPFEKKLIYTVRGMGYQIEDRPARVDPAP